MHRSRAGTALTPLALARVCPHPHAMQWVLQQFEDTAKLAEALDRLGLPYTWHKVVPFEGRLIPDPDIANPDDVILFGSYVL